MPKAKRVLIVEDHAIVRKMMRALFEGQGFEVWDASNGAEGIQQAEDVKPDLVILDLLMPVMNGFELARILKQRVPHIPLLMFTNSYEDGVEKEAQSSGISAVFSKSEGAEKLLSKANALLKDIA